MECHSKTFSCLHDIRKFKEWDGQCMQLAKVLADAEKCDIDGQELYQELLILPSLLPSGSFPVNVLNHITNNSIMDIFPNVLTSLCVLITLPISVASGKLSFSKLKIIKNYLRSTMSQDRLCGLATMTIENDSCGDDDDDNIYEMVVVVVDYVNKACNALGVSPVKVQKLPTATKSSTKYNDAGRREHLLGDLYHVT
ncbi:hypothetical protein PR048_023678 [Dryococelus australis]|uniref:HAT C-terminal dimerisation domain-containing protein n=1 Tax=Dryococelus australis TaxID=614101 RepID=A0ABQ9GUR7_9NEOP|nr:hypothetical protein PR048_023678 [Dryococelus australis]